MAMFNSYVNLPEGNLSGSCGILNQPIVKMGSGRWKNGVELAWLKCFNPRFRKACLMRLGGRSGRAISWRCVTQSTWNVGERRKDPGNSVASTVGFVPIRSWTETNPAVNHHRSSYSYVFPSPPETGEAVHHFRWQVLGDGWAPLQRQSWPLWVEERQVQREMIRLPLKKWGFPKERGSPSHHGFQVSTSWSKILFYDLDDLVVPPWLGKLQD